MTGRPAKSLGEHIRDATFRPVRHGHLLAGAVLDEWPGVARLQRAYEQATTQSEREAIERQVLRLIREVHEQLAERRAASGGGGSLQAALARLGRPGSFQQLEQFFPRYLRHQAGERAGQPFQLEQFQQAFLREFWRRDRRGRRLYTVGLLGIPKGNGKTPLAAGLGLFTLLAESDAPEVYGIAGSKDQAGIAQRFARGWAEQSELAQWITSGSILRCREHGGFYKLLSSDGRLGQGVNPSAGIADEWWLFQSAREREAYNALAHALHKRGPGRAWLLAITTAGYDKHTQLGETYDRAINHPQLERHQHGYLRILRDTASGFLFWWYGLPEDRNPDLEEVAVARACNPAPWLDPELLVRDLKRADTNELDWQRLHLNRWTASRDAWLPAGTWAALRSEREIPDGADIYIGVDIALRHDTSAVVWAARLAEGRVVLRCHTWSANPDAEAHQFVAGGEMRLELVEQFISELGRRYRIREIAYDPHFFARSAQLLEDRGFTTVEYLAASGPMSEATQGFYQACIEHQLTHNGDRVLAAHIDATAAHASPGGWKLRKQKSSQHIDATIAAVLATARACLATKPPVPRVFWIEA